MRKQRSTSTLPSYEETVVSDWQTTTTENTIYENQRFPTYFWPQQPPVPFHDYPVPDPYQDILQYGQGDASATNTAQSTYQQTDDGVYYEDAPSYYDPWSQVGLYSFLDQSFGDTYDPTLGYGEIDNQYQADESIQQQQQVLQYGVPVVSNCGAVTLLLRNLVRVDMTPDGAVCVYNFPAQSVAALNAAGNKFYVSHPNGTVYQEGPIINMVTGGDRLAKISPRGVTFSMATGALAYFTDESGTKTTTTGKFTDLLSKDRTVDVFYDGNHRSLAEMERECNGMLSEHEYQQRFHDGSEHWIFGGGMIKVSQDKWGEVTVSQEGCRRTVATSPTVRKVSIDSPAISVSVDCFSKNYFLVRKDSCSVSSGFCGMIVQKKSQKAGLDRRGRLVLF